MPTIIIFNAFWFTKKPYEIFYGSMPQSIQLLKQFVQIYINVSVLLAVIVNFKFL